jgi:hypothetical protein
MGLSNTAATKTLSTKTTKSRNVHHTRSNEILAISLEKRNQQIESLEKRREQKSLLTYIRETTSTDSPLEIATRSNQTTLK